MKFKKVNRLPINVKEVIRRRISNRTYEERPLTEEDKNSRFKWARKSGRVAKSMGRYTNKYLKENSIQKKVNHRSYQRQGIEQIPTIHLSISATQMEKQGIATNRGNINREVKYQNKIIKEIARQIKSLMN